MFGKASVTSPIIDGEMKAEKLCELLEIIPLIIARCSYNSRQPFCENSSSRLTTHYIKMRALKYLVYLLKLKWCLIECFFFFSVAVVFVVDSSHRDRISEAHSELAKLLTEKELRDALLLIFANKQVFVLKNTYFSSFVHSIS